MQVRETVGWAITIYSLPVFPIKTRETDKRSVKHQGYN
jgi:hypothetical protein